MKQMPNRHRQWFGASVGSSFLRSVHGSPRWLLLVVLLAGFSYFWAASVSWASGTTQIGTGANSGLAPLNSSNENPTTSGPAGVVPAWSTVRGGTNPPSTTHNATPPQAPNAKQIATRTLGFGIPFSISDPQNLYIEVQLYLSKDRGQNWQFYARQNTSAKEFPFQAAEDGEYWFALKTLDRNRQLLPPGPAQVELKVLVDTKQPEVDFRVQTDAAGRIVCRWRASDPAINPHSVAIAYRPLVSIDDRENQWIAVPYRPVTEPQAGVFADQYAWFMESAANEVLVRLQISDSAGNQVTEERQIIAPRVTMKSGQLVLANPAQPTAELNPMSSNSAMALPGNGSGPLPLQESARFAQLPTNAAATEKGTNSPVEKPTPWPPHPERRPASQSVGYGKPESETSSPTRTNETSGNSASPAPAIGASNNKQSITWESVSQHANGMKQASGSAWPQSAGEQGSAPLLGSQFQGNSFQAESSTSGTSASQTSNNSSPPISNRQTTDGPAATDKPIPSDPVPIDAGATKVNGNRGGPWTAAPPGSGPMLPDRNANSAGNNPTSSSTPEARSTVPLFEQSVTASPASPVDTNFERPGLAANSSATPIKPIGFQESNSEPSSVMAPPRKIEIIGSKRFRLNYDLGGIHPEDVERVLLWVTRDGGQTWSSLGEDADQTSPFPVQLDDVGTYGFRIVFHTRSGLSARTPARGDDADVWISIDVNPPVATLTAAPYGRGDQAGHLVIHWQAVDEQLQMRPISLAWSNHPSGPWTWIVERTENTGSFAWKIGSEIPDQVYLQLTAVDAAGNVTTNQTNDPIDLSGLIPRGRIIGVQPIK